MLITFQNVKGVIVIGYETTTNEWSIVQNSTYEPELGEMLLSLTRMECDPSFVSGYAPYRQLESIRQFINNNPDVVVMGYDQAIQDMLKRDKYRDNVVY